MLPMEFVCEILVVVEAGKKADDGADSLRINEDLSEDYFRGFGEI